MGQPFIGQITMFAGNFAIAGWLFPRTARTHRSDPTLFNLHRHHLWRRWRLHFRTAKSAIPGCDPIRELARGFRLT